MPIKKLFSQQRKASPQKGSPPFKKFFSAGFSFSVNFKYFFS